MTTKYEFDIRTLCPKDGKPDIYHCTVRARRLLEVEEILKNVATLEERKLYQEQVTQELHRLLGAEVETVGWHSGVRTTCCCGA